MITKYGEVLMREDTIIISGWKFEGEFQFDAVEWAKKRLDGKTSKKIETEGTKIGIAPKSNTIDRR